LWPGAFRGFNSSLLVIGTDAIIDETMLSVNGTASVTHCWTVAKMPAARPTVAPAAVDGLGSKKSSAKPPMYGFMLLDAGRGKDALVAFEAVTKKEPNRFLALYGAGKAAEASKQPAQAKEYYTQIVEICKDVTPDRPELVYAKKIAR
jgi:hypothetical protein